MRPRSIATAAIAQLVEHFIRNEKVTGSSPVRGSKNPPAPTLEDFISSMLGTEDAGALGALGALRALGGSNI